MRSDHSARAQGLTSSRHPKWNAFCRPWPGQCATFTSELQPLSLFAFCFFSSGNSHFNILLFSELSFSFFFVFFTIFLSAKKTKENVFSDIDPIFAIHWFLYFVIVILTNIIVIFNVSFVFLFKIVDNF